MGKITVYCITNGRKTYVGATKNFARRIRQHNQEIKGGAKYTKCTPGDWRLLVRIEGFEEGKDEEKEAWRDALRFEWRWKHIRRYRRGQNPAARRMACLDLTLERGDNSALTKVFFSSGKEDKESRAQEITDTNQAPHYGARSERHCVTLQDVETDKKSGT